MVIRDTTDPLPAHRGVRIETQVIVGPLTALFRRVGELEEAEKRCSAEKKCLQGGPMLVTDR